MATNCMALADVIVAGLPAGLTPTMTELPAPVVAKFVPVIVMVVPSGPLAGLKLVIVGGAMGTVKSNAPDNVDPPTDTLMGPVTAPAGTVTTNCVVLAELTVAAMPLNVTESLPVTGSKFVPVMVTCVPTAPLVGENPTSVAEVLVNEAALVL